VDVCSSAIKNFEAIGCTVDCTHPDMNGAMDVFKTLRASHYAAMSKSIPIAKQKLFKETLSKNIERGLLLSGDEINIAEIYRTQLTMKFMTFFENYDFLILPSTQVKPFDHNIEWVDNIEGNVLPNYIDWMSICCIISLFGLPAISVPCGFTSDGLPLGIQIVGKPRADLAVLKLAHAFEAVTKYSLHKPEIIEDS